MNKFFHSFADPQTVVLWFTYWMYVLIVFAPFALVINYVKVRRYNKNCVDGKLTLT